MRETADAIGMVQTSLCAKIDRIERDLPKLARNRLSDLVHEVRGTACEWGMMPLADISRALVESLAGDRRGSPMTQAYLHAMRDAAGCGRVDRATGDAYLASVSVRLVG